MDWRWHQLLIAVEFNEIKTNFNFNLVYWTRDKRKFSLQICAPFLLHVRWKKDLIQSYFHQKKFRLGDEPDLKYTVVEKQLIH